MLYLFFKDLKNYEAKLHLQNFNTEFSYRLIFDSKKPSQNISKLERNYIITKYNTYINNCMINKAITDFISNSKKPQRKSDDTLGHKTKVNKFQNPPSYKSFSLKTMK